MENPGAQNERTSKSTKAPPERNDTDMTTYRLNDFTPDDTFDAFNYLRAQSKTDPAAMDPLDKVVSVICSLKDWEAGQKV